MTGVCFTANDVVTVFLLGYLANSAFSFAMHLFFDRRGK